MLEILQPGIQTTVQDLGRHGQRHLGIAQCGAVDQPALILANRLLDNPAGCAALEIAIGPVAIRFHRDGWLALAGAEFDARLEGAPLWPGWRHPFSAGQNLRLDGPLSGMRTYLAIDGGIDVPVVLGARATDLRGGFGGFGGRALQAGDRLPLGSAHPLSGPRGTWRRPWTPELRAVPGPEVEEFDEASRRAFWREEWLVSSQSDRMAYRLQGGVLARSADYGLMSHGVLPGVVQVPPNGQPIVLLADAQTTGGYPRIACVLEADLWKLAQARPGARLRFVETDPDGACQVQRLRRSERYRFELGLAYGHRSKRRPG